MRIAMRRNCQRIAHKLKYIAVFRTDEMSMVLNAGCSEIRHWNDLHLRNVHTKFRENPSSRQKVIEVF